MSRSTARIKSQELEDRQVGLPGELSTFMRVAFLSAEPRVLFSEHPLSKIRPEIQMNYSLFLSLHVRTVRT